MATTHIINVPEIHCGHCKASIEGALNDVSGVTAATVDVDARNVSVDFDEDAVAVDILIAAIEDQGYEVPR